ncbi:MAG: sulfopyruvate decarboxylase subunit alpha [Candidatus Tectomicrobia bacterium]|nr:sulfopyruvate decarboxylase subunit alpha [Candidatus Tectomicrobia bacterium]
MTPATAKVIIEGLKQAGINFVTTLPEFNLQPLVQAIHDDAEIIHVPVCREEEGLGICAGAYLGGKQAAMVLMNTGFLLSANILTTLHYHTQIPVLMLIGYSGGMGEPYPAHTSLAKVTEPVLRALDIPYELVGRVDAMPKAIRYAQVQARSSRQPAAILMYQDVLFT